MIRFWYSTIYVLVFLLLSGCRSDTIKEVEIAPAHSPQILTDEELLDLVQSATLKYFWDLAEPNSGMARERYHEDEPRLDESLVTTGGTGFGIMAILVGIKREFITREDGFKRIHKIVQFIDTVPRFHGVWSHWIDGVTGTVAPFSPADDGGDLVETSFLIQGLLCARQFFLEGSEKEKKLSAQIDRIWKEVNWNFYRGANKENVLVWHWSPIHKWKINFKIHGYNETLITYLLAAMSPSYPIPAEVYHEGWADGGAIVEKDPKKPLRLTHQGDEVSGGPLFWAHYSYLGLDPRKLKDQYADYWTHNVQHANLNLLHCIDNPKNYQGYSEECWGLTASYSIDFYAAHSPKNDLGVISPTAALASFPNTPLASMKALRHFYEDLGAKILGAYGFYDAFSIHFNWYPRRYLAIDQGPIIVMIENYRSNFLWDLFMSSPEIKPGLEKLGFYVE